MGLVFPDQQKPFLLEIANNQGRTRGVGHYLNGNDGQVRLNGILEIGESVAGAIANGTLGNDQKVAALFLGYAGLSLLPPMINRAPQGMVIGTMDLNAPMEKQKPNGVALKRMSTSGKGEGPHWLVKTLAQMFSNRDEQRLTGMQVLTCGQLERSLLEAFKTMAFKNRFPPILRITNLVTRHDYGQFTRQ